MDAIECGIVKLPRVPVAENIPGNEMPMFRDLWESIRKDMPTKGRGKGEELDPLKLPTRLQTALEALYGHYEKTFTLWEEKGIKVPPAGYWWGAWGCWWGDQCVQVIGYSRFFELYGGFLAMRTTALHSPK
jgi:hypothetical protein